jgi:hypothetical protein
MNTNRIWLKCVRITALVALAGSATVGAVLAAPQTVSSLRSHNGSAARVDQYNTAIELAEEAKQAAISAELSLTAEHSGVNVGKALESLNQEQRDRSMTAGPAATSSRMNRPGYFEGIGYDTARAEEYNTERELMEEKQQAAFLVEQSRIADHSGARFAQYLAAQDQVARESSRTPGLASTVPELSFPSYFEVYNAKRELMAEARLAAFLAEQSRIADHSGVNFGLYLESLDRQNQ